MFAQRCIVFAASVGRAEGWRLPEFYAGVAELRNDRIDVVVIPFENDVSHGRLLSGDRAKKYVMSAHSCVL